MSMTSKKIIAAARAAGGGTIWADLGAKLVSRFSAAETDNMSTTAVVYASRTPPTADGQSIPRLYESVGLHDFNTSQGIAAIYRTDGTKHWIQLHQNSLVQEVAPGMSANFTDDMEFFIALRSTDTIVSLLSGDVNFRSFGRLTEGGTGNPGYGYGSSSVPYTNNIPISGTITDGLVWSEWFTGDWVVGHVTGLDLSHAEWLASKISIPGNIANNNFRYTGDVAAWAISTPLTSQERADVVAAMQAET